MPKVWFIIKHNILIQGCHQHFKVRSMKLKQNVGLIILAAGASVRYGASKQLLSFNGETFLRRIVRESLESVCQPIVVVFGADARNLSRHVDEFAVRTIQNDNWKKGMGTSISVGMKKLLEIDEEIAAAVITVCDQPFVTSDVINDLVQNFDETQALIVASRYAETLGVPALFSRRLFSDLRTLKNSGGAKELIKRFSAETVAINFSEGAIDIDTPEDFRRLKTNLLNFDE